MDKCLISKRFGRASASYSKAAVAQQMIVERLLGLMPDNLNCNKLLEIGCGTGLLSRPLLERLNPRQADLNDISLPVSNCLSDILCPSVHFIHADAELMDYERGYDMIASSSAIQWFCNPADFFYKAAQSLNPKGMLLISTFGPKNLYQVNNLTGTGLKYRNTQELHDLINKYFDIHNLFEEEITLLFDSPLHVLQHMKATGVTGTSQQTWTRNKHNEFITRYTEAFELDGRYTLTYNPVYIVATKKDT